MASEMGGAGPGGLPNEGPSSLPSVFYLRRDKPGTLPFHDAQPLAFLMSRFLNSNKGIHMRPAASQQKPNQYQPSEADKQVARSAHTQHHTLAHTPPTPSRVPTRCHLTPCIPVHATCKPVCASGPEAGKRPEEAAMDIFLRHALPLRISDGGIAWQCEIVSVQHFMCSCVQVGFVLGAIYIGQKVDSDKIQDNTIVASDLNSEAQAFLQSVPEDGVSASSIRNGSVSSGKIADLAVSNSKLADDSVDSRVIQNLTVATSDIAPGAVTTMKISDREVVEDKLSQGVQDVLDSQRVLDR